MKKYLSWKVAHRWANGGCTESSYRISKFIPTIHCLFH